MKRILITGVSGFIGRHLVERLTAAGYQIITLVRASSETDWLSQMGVTVATVNMANVEQLQLDLKSLIEAHGKFDAVIHNAGITQTHRNSDYYKVNVGLTKNLIHALSHIQEKPAKFIYTSSLSAVGPGDVECKLALREDQEPNPLTHYGRSKLEAENFIRAQKELPWIIFRPSIVYGPNEKNFFQLIEAINKGLELYVGSKNQQLSLIYVKDLTTAYLNVLKADKDQQIYHLSDGLNYSASQLNQSIKSVLAKKTLSMVIPITLVRILALMYEAKGRMLRKAPILNSDKVNEMKQLNWMCDSQKIKQDLGFVPSYSLQESIQETVAWYKDNGWI